MQHQAQNNIQTQARLALARDMREIFQECQLSYESCCWCSERFFWDAAANEYEDCASCESVHFACDECQEREGCPIARRAKAKKPRNARKINPEMQVNYVADYKRFRELLGQRGYHACGGECRAWLASNYLQKLPFNCTQCPAYLCGVCIRNFRILYACPEHKSKNPHAEEAEWCWEQIHKSIE